MKLNKLKICVKIKFPKIEYKKGIEEQHLHLLQCN